MNLITFPNLLSRPLGVRGAGGGGGTYLDKILGIQPAALVGLWPLNESSGTAIVDAGSGGYNGTYSNVSLANALGPDGVNSAPLFNGTTSKGDLFSSALESAIDFAEGTLSIWYKVLNASVLSDGALRDAFWMGTTGDANELYHRKSSVSNRVDAYRVGSTIPDGAQDVSATSTAWVHKAITWSIAGDAVKVYKNGALLASASTLGAWSASANRILIGCKNTNTLVWSGWLAYVGIWSTPLSLEDVQAVADPNP